MLTSWVITGFSSKLTRFRAALTRSTPYSDACARSQAEIVNR